MKLLNLNMYKTKYKATYPKSSDCIINSPMPGIFNPEQILTSLHTQVTGLLHGSLQEKAMLPLIHIFRLLNHPEHCLVYCPD